jgi:hypothetical protein
MFERYDSYDQVHQKCSKLSIKILPINIIKMVVISKNILSYWSWNQDTHMYV